VYRLEINIHGFVPYLDTKAVLSRTSLFLLFPATDQVVCSQFSESLIVLMERGLQFLEDRI
jgi:hypothetical protein